MERDLDKLRMRVQRQQQALKRRRYTSDEARQLQVETLLCFDLLLQDVQQRRKAQRRNRRNDA
jgi:hypothetical protein